jgi:hypothetical protein
MKRIAAITLFSILAFVTADWARAQDFSVRASVPFAFTVSNKPFPPGNYEITTHSRGVIEVRNRYNSVAVLTTTTHNYKVPGNGAKLVFNKYGSQLFLSEILSPYIPLNVSLPSSNEEKWARQQETIINPSSPVFITTK